MSAPLTSQRLALEDLQDAPQFMEKVCQVYNEHHDQVSERFKRNYVEAVFEQYDFVHGTEKLIKVPESIGGMPAGIEHVRCRGLEVDSASKWTGKYYTLGIQRMDWREIQRKPGDPPQVGVTVYYAPPFGQAHLSRENSQTITTSGTGGWQSIQWDTQQFVQGAITHSTSSNPQQIIFGAAGIVQLIYTVQFAAAATGVRQAVTIKNNDDNERRGHGQNSAPTAGDEIFFTCAAEWEVAAGNELRVNVVHSRGSDLAISTSAKNRCRIYARYVAPARTTTGRVRLRFDKE